MSLPDKDLQRHLECMLNKSIYFVTYLLEFLHIWRFYLTQGPAWYYSFEMLLNAFVVVCYTPLVLTCFYKASNTNPGVIKPYEGDLPDFQE